MLVISSSAIRADSNPRVVNPHTVIIELAGHEGLPPCRQYCAKSSRFIMALSDVVGEGEFSRAKMTDYFDPPCVGNISVRRCPLLPPQQTERPAEVPMSLLGVYQKVGEVGGKKVG